MADELSQLLYGVIGGGVAATGLKLIESYFIAPRLTESLEARRKLFLYAKPLWVACHEMQYRLNTIVERIERHDSLTDLQLSPKAAKSFDWYTKDGYYVVSTAYLIAEVTCWIALYERDIVFLQFGKKTLTAEFYRLIIKLKTILSTNTILWFYYIDGIGEQLIEPEQNKPMTLANFSLKLYKDELFGEYYDQLFQFLARLSDYPSMLKDACNCLEKIKAFLEKNGIVSD